MPFTTHQFLDVFAAYNNALWPLAFALWVVTAIVFVAFVVRDRVWMPLPTLLLAGHWLWSALLYHAIFFTAVNPAAWLFAALFVVQAVLFIVASSSGGAVRARRGSVRHVVSSALILYGLVYPALVWAEGFRYPRMPTFGVPCPTVMLTIGFLLAVSTSSVLLSAIPAVWSGVGLSAVLSFGVHADLVLPVAGTVLAIDLVRQRSHVMKKLSFAGMLAVLVATLLVVPAPAALAQASQHEHAQPAAQKGGMKMGEMKMDATMMAEMAAMKKANTERITALMTTVKGATGEAKVVALADVIAILLEERAAMQEHCAAMMQMMQKMQK